jgi:uncharacterized metal-binding protein
MSSFFESRKRSSESQSSVNPSQQDKSKRNEILDLEKSNHEKVDSFNEYYKSVLPGVTPLPLYKNTKFLTAQKLDGGILDDNEIQKEIECTGFCFNLINSGYFVIDVDIDSDLPKDLEFSEDANLLGVKLEEVPDKIIVREFNLNTSQKNFRKLQISTPSTILFCVLFRTPFVRTPSGGYHFYFKNDLNDEQIVKIFGKSLPRYVKSIEMFGGVVDIDIFIDNKINDSFLVLPFTKVYIENSDVAVKHTFELSYYSGLRKCVEPSSIACNDFAKASTLLKWLLERVKKTNYEIELRSNDLDSNKWNERGKAIQVAEFNKVLYLKYIKSDFSIIAENVRSISTYATYPFNLFILICTIAFFPNDMHYDLLVILYETLFKVMSPNCKRHVLNYYDSITSNLDKKQFLKHPKYLESIINHKFDTAIDHKYEFIHEFDINPTNKNGEEVEIFDDDDDLPNNGPKDTIKKFINDYGDVFGDYQF